MKRNILYVLSTFILIVSQVVYAQETNIPGWPCTGSNSNSIQYINSTLIVKVILVEFSDIKPSAASCNKKKDLRTRINDF